MEVNLKVTGNSNVLCRIHIGLHFPNFLLVRRVFCFDSIYTEINSQGSNYTWTSVGSVNDLESNRRQAIIWTNDGIVHWRTNVSLGIGIFTHWSRDKTDAISQTIFSNTFSWMITYEFWLQFHWSLFLRVQLTIFRHWLRKWLGAIQATSHNLNQGWLVSQRIYVSLGLNGLIDYTVKSNPNNVNPSISGTI